MANFSFDSITVKADATLILGANTKRKGFILFNTDTVKTVHLGMDNSVATGKGMPMGPGLPFSMGHKNEMWQGDIFGVGEDVNVRFWTWGE